MASRRRELALAGWEARAARAILQRMDDINIRVSTGDGDDGVSLRRLAELGQSRPPAAPVVLAEVDGRPVAAMGISDGHAVADPARASSWVMTVLRLRRLETRAIIAVFGA